MGKGRIVSHLGDGLYNVELLHNRDRINTEIAQLAQLIAELDAELTELETERDALVAERDAITAQIDASIAAAVAEGETPDVDALLAELAQASAAVQAQDVRISLVRGRRLEAVKRRQALEAVPADPVQQAWCADYTEGLTGEVATVEVPAEADGKPLRPQIRPGYDGRANYLPSRDGQMFHREGQVGYQAYFNAAILPGVQRHKPQYRIGVITTLDYEAHTCSLTIQGEDSSAQALIIDPPDLVYTKTGVPIEYMECDSAAFEEGDRVLVEFQGRDWNSPKVIGFEQEPKQCLPEYIVLRTHTYNKDKFAPIWDSRDGTFTVVPLSTGRRIIRTEFDSWRIHIDVDLPPGLPTTSTPHPLYLYYWTTSIRWTHARAFNQTVGGDEELPAGPYLPDGWDSSDEIMIIDPQVTDLNYAWWRQFAGDPEVPRIAEVQMTGVQLPSVLAGEDHDKWADVWGYDTLYRYTVSGKAYWQCAGVLTEETYQSPIPCADDEFRRRLFVGQFKLELEREGVGELPDEIDALSGNSVPSEFEVNGVKYIRKETGWLADPERTVGVVYARADVAGDPVEFAPGFWAE